MLNSLDICVLTAGRFDLLANCLDAIEVEIAHTKEVSNIPISVYIFDNGSESKDAILFKPILERPFITKTKRIGTNLGFSGGANAVIKLGQSPLVLFVSDDVVLQKGCILSLLDTMLDPTVGLCGLKLLFPKRGNNPGRPAGKVQHVGHSINLQGEIIHPFMGWSADNPRTCVSGERFSVTGASFMVRRDLFVRAGRFNEIYNPGYYEDVELCLHIRQLGFKIWVDTNAVAEHFVGATYGSKQPNPNMGISKMNFMEHNKQFLTWTDWSIR